MSLGSAEAFTAPPGTQVTVNDTQGIVARLPTENGLTETIALGPSGTLTDTTSGTNSQGDPIQVSDEVDPTTGTVAFKSVTDNGQTTQVGSGDTADTDAGLQESLAKLAGTPPPGDESGTDLTDPGDHPADDPQAPFAAKHPSPVNPRDPLVLDLAGAGIMLSSVAQSAAHFDFTGSGFATKSGWITQGEGLLVLDGNPNAPINVNELVGAASGDGFADLTALDSDGNGVINASDPVFARLSVWVDANGNGQLDSGELVSLGSLGITSINLSSTPSGQTINGNTVVSTATFQMNGTSGAVTNAIAEVDLATNPIESRYTPPAGFAYNSAVFSLPQLVGYGTVPNLWAAMSQDPQLLSDVQNLVVNAGSMSAAEFNTAFQAMVWEWVGATNIDPTSRGAYIDARDLAVDYAFYGIDQTTEPVYQLDPNWHSGPLWQTVYTSIIDELKVRFVGQIAAGQLLNGVDPASIVGSWFMPFTTIKIDLHNDTVTANFNSLIHAIVSGAPSDPTAAATYYQQVMPIAQGLRVDLFGEQASGVTVASLAAAGGLGYGTDVQTALLAGLGVGLIDEGANTGALTTTLANGAVFLGTGDKTITGGSNDVYVYTPAGGNDTITSWGTDAAIALSGLNPGDVRLGRAGSGMQDLVIVDSATGKSLTVANQFGSNAVTSIVFADGTAYNEAQIDANAPIRGIPGQAAGYDTSENLAATYDLGAGDYSNVSAWHDSVVSIVWGAADGNQAFTIEGNDYQNGGSLVLNNLNPADVSFYRSGTNLTDLTIQNKSTGKAIIIYNEFLNAWQGTASVSFGSGTVWQYSDIASNTYITAASGTYNTNSLTGTIRYDLGNGTFGNVTAFHDQTVEVIWGAGDSSEAFTLEGNYQNTASVLLGGLNPANVSFYRSGANLTDLTIRNNAGGQTLTLYNEFVNSWEGAASVAFANGAVWHTADIAANTYVTAASGTYNTNSLTGTIRYDLGTGTFGNVSAFHDQAVEVIWGAGDSSEAFSLEGNYQNTGSVVLKNLNRSDVSIYRSGASFGDLTIRNNASGNTLTLSNEFSNAWQGAASIAFGDGTVWQTSDITANSYITAASSASGTYNTSSLNGTTIYDLGTGTFGNVSAFHDQAAEVIWGPADSNQAFTFEGNYQNTGSVLLAGLNPADVSFYRSGSNLADLIIQNKTTGNTLTISNQFANAWQGVASVTFANGTVWNRSQIASNVPNLMTTPTNTSNLPNLTYDLGAGDYGNVTVSHDDPLTVEWGAGNGNQTFTIETNYTNDAKALFFGLNPSDVTLIRSGSSLVNLTVVNNRTGKTLTLANQFSGNTWQGVNAIQFANGTTWSQSQIVSNTLITAASSSNGAYNTSTSAGGVTYDLGTGNFGNVSAWHDPAVEVIWGAGDSNQAFTIEGNYVNVGSVALSGLTPANVSFYRSGYSLTDLTIRNNANGHTLTISNEFNNSYQGVASVTFADGTVWHTSDIAANTYITAASGSYNTNSVSGTIIYDLGTGSFGNVSAWHDAAVEVIWGAGDSNQAFTIEGNYVNVGSVVLSGLTPANVSFYRSGYSLTDLTIRNNANGHTLTISNEFNNYYQGVASVTFADGTVWHTSDIAANTYITTASGSYNTNSLSGTIIYDLGTGSFGNVSAWHDAAVEVIWGAGDSNQAFTIEGNYVNVGSVALTNLDSAHVGLSRTGSSGQNLVITNSATGASLTLSNEFVNTWEGAASIQFSDGASVNVSQTDIFSWLGAANSTLRGSNCGTNVFAFGAGAETAIGGTTAASGTGKNTYQFGTQSGQATIQVNGTTGGTNELDFGSGISDNLLWFQQSGNDLQIDLMGTTKEVTIKGWFGGSTNQLQEITAGGLKIDTQVGPLVQAMATYAAANPGFDPTLATQVPNDPNLQNALTAAWHS